MARRRWRKPGGNSKTAPTGPSPDSATNLIMADILIRTGSYVVRRVVERNLLKGRYGKDAARDIVANRKPSQTLAAMAAARLAARSVPGAAIVGSGLLLKTLYDFSNRRRARQRGDARLLEQARGED